MGTKYSAIIDGDDATLTMTTLHGGTSLPIPGGARDLHHALSAILREPDDDGLRQWSGFDIHPTKEGVRIKVHQRGNFDIPWRWVVPVMLTVA